MVEKRKNRRMPIIKQFGEPVMLEFQDQKVPGIILDLSADGVSLMTYTTIPVGTDVCLSISIPSINFKTKPMNGDVVWALQKGDMWRIGMHISQIDTLDAKHINRMAIDFNDCENKIMLGVPDVCSAKCSYYKICEKPQKIKA